MNTLRETMVRVMALNWVSREMLWNTDLHVAPLHNLRVPVRHLSAADKSVPVDQATRDCFAVKDWKHTRKHSAFVDNHMLELKKMKITSLAKLPGNPQALMGGDEKNQGRSCENPHIVVAHGGMFALIIPLADIHWGQKHLALSFSVVL